MSNTDFNIKMNLDKDFVHFLKFLYQKYDENLARINGFHNENLNFTDFIDNFIDSQTVADVSPDTNANSSTKDVNTLMSDMTKPHSKLLSYNKIFYELKKAYGLEIAEEWFEDEYNGVFYLHNAATSTFKPYCFAYDLDEVVEKGLFFINKFKSKPAQHLTTFNDHVLEFISWNSNRTSGAVGLPSYLIYSFYFWKKDVENNFYLKNPEYYRRQCFQKFIYDLNQPYLRITECAFTNITIMDREYLVSIFGDRKYPDGTNIIDYIEELIEYQKCFMEVVSEIRKEQFMTFPVLTYSLLYQNNKFVDEEFAKWCCNHNNLWYDSNFYVGNDVASLSNCCRLLSDTKKLKGFINSIGGTSLQIGSVQVNTINLRRIALIADMLSSDKTKSEIKFYFMFNLKQKVELCIKVLKIIRRIIKRNVEKGLLPNYSYGLIKLEKQYSTIGITAMYEALNDLGMIEEDEFGNKYYTKEGLEFASDIFSIINECIENQNVDFSFNIEAVPAERANVVLCQKDNLIYKPNKEYFIYSNQWIPLQEKCTLDEKIKLGSILDKQCGGGQISHINLQAPFNNDKQSWDLLNYIASKGVIYFAYNVKTFVCEDGHGFFGQICPNCGKPVADSYSRVVGFLTPVSSYSKERRQEFNKRKWFDLNEN